MEPQEFGAVPLIPCSLDELSDVRVRYALADPPATTARILVISLRGRVANDIPCVYEHCTAMILAGLEGWRPSAVVLDLTEVEYDWGDLMGNVLTTPQRWFHGEGRELQTLMGERPRLPVAVVASPRCRDGLTSLVAEQMRSDIPLHEDLAGAVARVDADLAAWPGPEGAG